MKVQLDSISCTFDKIYIIESLPDGEKPTGSQLYVETIVRKTDQLNLPIKHQLITVSTKIEFFDILNSIAEEVEINCYHPIIHFEIHGDEIGFELKSGEEVKWEDLTEVLRKINLKTQNNTFLTLATCFGIYIYKTIKPNYPSPFWGTISPKGKINPSKALAGFQSFFEVLLETGDLNKSVDTLNDEYEESGTTFYFRNSLYSFDLAYRNYESKYFTEEAINWRIEDAFVKTKEEYLKNNITGISDAEIREQARFLIINPNIQAKMKSDMFLKFMNNGEFSN
ncbi:hypothetical protein [Aquirufa nivalisilvae]